MPTITSPAPWTASDEASRKASRPRVAAERWQHIGHLRPSQLKALLQTEVIPAEAELKSIHLTIANYVAEIGEADSRHNEITKPLQAEISNAKTTTDRRIECR